ncbi:MAG: hypothetical protein ACI87A_003672, partial [Planctomycetota bacterium]
PNSRFPARAEFIRLGAFFWSKRSLERSIRSGDHPRGTN